MNEFLGLLESITLLGVVKWLVLLLLAVYNVFAYLMMRQTGAMTRAITMRDDYVVRVLSAAHFTASVLVLLLAILIL